MIVSGTAVADPMKGRYTLTASSKREPVKDGDRGWHSRCSADIDKQLERWRGTIQVEYRGVVLIDREPWVLIKDSPSPFEAIREEREGQPFVVEMFLRRQGATATGGLVVMQKRSDGTISCATAVKVSGKYSP